MPVVFFSSSTYAVVAANAFVLFEVSNGFQKDYLGHVQTKTVVNPVEFNRDSYHIPKILDIRDAENYAKKYQQLLCNGIPMDVFGNVTKNSNGIWRVELVPDRQSENGRFCSCDIQSDGTLIDYITNSMANGQLEYPNRSFDHSQSAVDKISTKISYSLGKLGYDKNARVLMHSDVATAQAVSGKNEYVFSFY